jgi:hypothetical protein
MGSHKPGRKTSGSVPESDTCGHKGDAHTHTCCRQALPTRDTPRATALAPPHGSPAHSGTVAAPSLHEEDSSA